MAGDLAATLADKNEFNLRNNKMKYWIVLSAWLLAASGSLQAAEQKLSQQEEQQLGQIRSILVKHPEIIPGVLGSIESYVEQRQLQQQALAKHKDWLFNNPQMPTMGSSKPELQLVVFTDYNCPYCKRMELEFAKLLKEFPNLQVVNVFVPLRQIKAQGTELSSGAFALEIWRQDRKDFPRVHELLMAKNGMHTGNSLQQVAKATGTEQYLKPSSSADELMHTNVRVFSELGFGGTPTLLIGDEVIPGYIDYATLKAVVQQVLERQG